MFEDVIQNFYPSRYSASLLMPPDLFSKPPSHSQFLYIRYIIYVFSGSGAGDAVIKEYFQFGTAESLIVKDLSVKSGTVLYVSVIGTFLRFIAMVSSLIAPQWVRP